MKLDSIRESRKYLVQEDMQEAYLETIWNKKYLAIETVEENWIEHWYRLELNDENYLYLSKLLEWWQDGSEAPKEIEMKFMLSRVPEHLSKYKRTFIRQGYIFITSFWTELRIRDKGWKYYLTIKKWKWKVRLEWEILIQKKDFDTLWTLTNWRIIEKARYEVPYIYESDWDSKEQIIEIDIFWGKLSWLKTAEAEFKSEEESNSFVKPDYLWDDLTEDKRFKNQNLALLSAKWLRSLLKEIKNKVKNIIS